MDHSDTEMTIRPARDGDEDAIWAILEPVLRAGETYALPADWSGDEALSFWMSPDKHCYVFEDEGQILGTYYLKANQMGGGRHVANCGYVTSPAARGRGIAGKMCLHSLNAAKALGFRAMQYNLVVATNEGAIRLWQKYGFDIIGTLPKAFDHPTKGDVDALILYRLL